MSVDVEKVVREYIEKSPHMSMATVVEGKPWVCEVHFVYDEDLSLYFVSKNTTRHCQEIAINPQVAGNIIKQHALTEAPTGIYFEGEAKEINASHGDVEHYVTALGRDLDQVTKDLQTDRRMYRIIVKNWAVFGDFDGNGHTKSELTWGEV